MGGSAHTARMPGINSCRAFFRFAIACQDQSLEMRFESTSDFFSSQMRAARAPFSGMGFGHIFSLAILNSSSVAPFRCPNSDSRNGVRFATSRQASKISASEAHHSHEVFLGIRPNSSSEGERCMKDTDHPIRHPSVHLRISRRPLSKRSCAWHDDQFGHGQNTGLGWSDPTFVHASVPKVIRRVAPAQLRGDREECFVRASFRNRGPQR